MGEEEEFADGGRGVVSFCFVVKYMTAGRGFAQLV